MNWDEARRACTECVIGAACDAHSEYREMDALRHDLEQARALLQSRPPVVHRVTCTVGTTRCTCDIDAWLAAVTVFLEGTK